MAESQQAGSQWEERMRRAAEDCHAKREVADASQELRDRLVLEGIDSGRRIADVAKAALISPGRVHQLIARHG